MESIRKQIDNDAIIKSNQIFANALIHSRIQINVYYFQTDSYSKHKALENFYKEIDNLYNTYIEIFQGKYSILKNYRGINIDNNPEKCIEYLRGLEKINNLTKLGPFDSDLNSIKDTINQLINKTIYILSCLN